MRSGPTRRLRLAGAVALLASACTVTANSTHIRSRPTTSSPNSPSPVPARARAVPPPPIVRDLIPYAPTRRAEMAAYARRHYGIDTYRLEDPKVIVEHFTASSTFAPVYEEFARDVPDPELHELPGLCTHFVVDTDGAIHQLVPLGLMCRHTVGLNYTALGIEMVGASDGEILANPRELGSALRLTLWLMTTDHIELRNVIGHNESLTSPYHRELVSTLRCQTHADWNHADMQTFRSKLSALARPYGVDLGPQPSGATIPGC
jgi:N-acetylmuramoyl-L-alanine amidase